MDKLLVTNEGGNMNGKLSEHGKTHFRGYGIPECCLNCSMFDWKPGKFGTILSVFCRANVFFPTKKKSCARRDNNGWVFFQKGGKAIMKAVRATRRRYRNINKERR